MTPSMIHSILTEHYPELNFEQRSNPDGWAYFLGPKRGGIKSNRILRAVANSQNQNAQVKPAISCRLKSSKEFVFDGSEKELLDLVKSEIALYKEHFERD